MDCVALTSTREAALSPTRLTAGQSRRKVPLKKGCMRSFFRSLKLEKLQSSAGSSEQRSMALRRRSGVEAATIPPLSSAVECTPALLKYGQTSTESEKNDPPHV